MKARSGLLISGALLTGLLILVTGCSSSSTSTRKSGAASDSPTGTTTGAPAGDTSYLTRPTVLPVTKPLSAKPPTGVHVAFLNPGVSYTQGYLQGLQAASKVLGWKIDNISVNQAEPSSFSSGITSALNSGAKYILIGNSPASLYAGQLDAVKAKGAKIIDYNTSNPQVPGVVQTTLTDTTIIATGALVARALIADAKAQGKTAHIGEVTVPIYASVLKPIQQGFATTVAQQCSACTIASIPIPAQQLVSGNYAPVIVSYLQAHRDINYLVFDLGSVDSGITTQIRLAGLPKQRIFGIGGSAPEIQAIKSGDQLAWSVAPSVVDGWILADTIARVTVGDDASVWNTTPVRYVVEKSNADAYLNGTQFPDGYQGMFRTMWKV